MVGWRGACHGTDSSLVRNRPEKYTSADRHSADVHFPGIVVLCLSIELHMQPEESNQENSQDDDWSVFDFGWLDSIWIMGVAQLNPSVFHLVYKYSWRGLTRDGR